MFVGENVDIHHICPQAWCKDDGISPAVYDSIINKTPLSDRTDRIIGGVTPSKYLAKLEKGSSKAQSIEGATLDGHLHSYLIDPAQLRSDDFEAFTESRQKAFLKIIEQAMGKTAYTRNGPEGGLDVESDAETAEAGLTIPLQSAA